MAEAKLEYESVTGKTIAFEDIDAARAHLSRVETRLHAAEELFHSDGLCHKSAVRLEQRIENFSLEGSMLEDQIDVWQSQKERN